jgi:hypothetical protein
LDVVAVDDELPDRPQPAATSVTTVSGTATRRAMRQYVIPLPPD